MSAASDPFQADYCAERLKALSDPHRLRIVAALRHGELTVTDLTELLETEMVTVSHHLKILRHADIVVVRREGRFMYYKLHPDLVPGPGPGSMSKVLDLGCCRLEVPDSEPPSS